MQYIIIWLIQTGARGDLGESLLIINTYIRITYFKQKQKKKKIIIIIIKIYS
jgi:hypothetical protein